MPNKRGKLRGVLEKAGKKVSSFVDSTKKKVKEFEENQKVRQLDAIEKEKTKKEFLKEKLETVKLENKIIEEKKKREGSSSFGNMFPNLGKSQADEFVIPGLIIEEKGGKK